MRVNSGNTRRKRWLWRWRRNPLRRPSDVVEAWILLVVWTLAVLGGTIAGLAAGRAAQDSFADQRAGRTPVSAVLLENAPAGVVTEAGTGGDQVGARVRWTAADGSARQGTAMVDAGRKAGATVRVWTDGRGNLTTAPPTTGQAAAFTGYVSTAAAITATAAVYAAGRLARAPLDRRRREQWDREWERVEPQWARRTP